MTAVDLALIRLYPKPCRDHWGQGLGEAVRAGGLRSVPNVVLGAVDMWLHPAIWPTRYGGQRHARAAAMAIAVCGDGWFIANVTTEDGSGRFLPILRCCGIALALGLLLVAPRPRCVRRAFVVLLRRCAVDLAPPALLIIGVVYFVHTEDIVHAPPALRLTTLGIWWGAWLLMAANGSRILANLGPDVALAPSRHRSSSGIAVLTGSAMVSAAVLLIYAFTNAGFDAVAAIWGTQLLALSLTLFSTIHELATLADDGSPCPWPAPCPRPGASPRTAPPTGIELSSR